MMGWYDNDMGAAGWVFMIAAMMIFWGLVATHTSSGITRVGVPRGQMIFRGTAGGRGGLGRQDLGALEILDAMSLSPVAAVHIPHLIPPGFHGNWIAAS
ncbi:carotenoid oxygenase family protein [uncultured Nocardioides sp.]|mgnify:CR=1 FL=1|uniref:carotenoid oxygenase family protein n=2 Tax=uncultured Nocardioides sp. TaxID=198441 RepID=UPI002632655D|nr:carotenoid oxygenase family protein [uncultured Nocardioides sp.]